MGDVKRTFVCLLSAASLAAGCGGQEPDERGHDHAAEAQEYSEAYDELVIGKADGACSGVVTPDQSGFDRRIALTFDDGPNASTTPQVLDILEEEGIKATFFINGNRVTNATRPILQRIVDEGHILANHSQSHRNLSSAALSTVRSEVRSTHEVIDTISVPEYFRFPYGASTCATAEIVREDFEQIVTGWNVDTGDWCFAPDDGYCPASRFQHVPNDFRDDMVGWTMQQVRAKGGGIVLMHDIHAYTANTLPSMIARMRGEGYTFTNLDDAETFPLLNGEGIDLAWVGDECVGDDDCNMGPAHRGLCDLPEGSTAAACTIECEGFCPDRGSDTTFCVSLDGGYSGTCVLKAGRDASCEDDHLVLETHDRFLGYSGAPARTADVCVPR